MMLASIFILPVVGTYHGINTYVIAATDADANAGASDVADLPFVCLKTNRLGNEC